MSVLIPPIFKVRSSTHYAIPSNGPSPILAQVTGGGGHFSIEVVSPVFAGKSMLESQRLVYAAIAHLMKGDLAPVHAVNQLKTRAPKAT